MIIKNKIAVLFLLTFTGRNSFACMHDCSQMAGTECTISTGCSDGPTSGRNQNTNYPNQPQNLQILPIPYGQDIPGQNITWISDGSSTNPDSFGVMSQKLSDPDNSITCVWYNINGELPASAQFYHNCSEQSDYYHEVFSLPRANPDTDYQHRVVSVFSQNHNAANTVTWHPYLVEIHNDSCRSTVTLTFDTPPAEYGFQEFVIHLRDSNNDAVDSYDDVINSSQLLISVNFSNVPDDLYYIKIYHNPAENGQEEPCSCKRDGACALCSSTETGQFLINASHPKCYIPTTDNSPESGNGLSTTFIGIVSLLAVIGIIIIVVLVVLIYRRFYYNKPQSEDSLLRPEVSQSSPDTLKTHLTPYEYILVNKLRHHDEKSRAPSSYKSPSEIRSESVSYRLEPESNIYTIGDHDHEVLSENMSTLDGYSTYTSPTVASEALERGVHTHGYSDNVTEFSENTAAYRDNVTTVSEPVTEFSGEQMTIYEIPMATQNNSVTKHSAILAPANITIDMEKHTPDNTKQHKHSDAQNGSQTNNTQSTETLDISDSDDDSYVPSDFEPTIQIGKQDTASIQC